MNLLQKCLKKVVVSYLFLSLTLCYGQTIKNYTIADGLPGNSIKSIYKDSRGLLWIGTVTGLCNYDGTRFKIFGEEDGLKHNTVWKIIEDNQNNLWMSLYGNGIAKYDGQQFTYFDKNNGLVNNSVRVLFHSKKHNCLLIGTEDGFSIFDGKTFKNFKPKTERGIFQVSTIIQYGNKILLTTIKDKVYEVIIDGKNIQNSKLSEFSNPDMKNYSVYIKGDEFHNRNSNWEYIIQNLKTKEIVFNHKSSIIWDFAEDNEGFLYGAAWDVNEPTGGILRYKNGILTNIAEELNISSYQFWCLYFDKVSEQLWAGSVNQGVYVIDLSRKTSFKNANNFSLSQLEINTLFIDGKNTLWIGGNDVILKKESNGKQITLNTKDLYKQLVHYQNSLGKNKNRGFLNYFNASRNFICHDIKQDSIGNMWMMTTYGIICFDNNLNVKRHHYIYETGGCIDFLNNHSEIFQTYYYQNVYQLSTDKLKVEKEILYNGKSIKLTPKRLAKTNDTIWIASPKGLFRYNNGELLSMNELGFYTENSVNEVIVDNKNQIVSGTTNGKVYFSKWEQNKLIHFKILYPNKELIGNSIFFIQQYGAYYFIGTNKGINIIKDYKLYKFLNNEESILQSEYTYALIDKVNKKLLVATHEGLLTIDIPKLLKQEKVNHPIKINAILINGEPSKKAEWSFSNKLKLPYNQNNIEIHFNSNNTYNPNKTLYRYKILHLSDKWSKYSTESTIKLHGLHHGKYKVIIEAKNIGTGESLKPISFLITILPPFWLTWWFVSLILLVLVITSFIYLRKKVKRIKDKAVIEKRIAETKLQALQSQINPHFAFNAMNSIQNFVIDNKTDDALWYIGEFSKLMRQTLNFSSRTSIRLEEEIEYLKRYSEIENLRRRLKATVDFIVQEDLNIQEIEIPPMLLQPIVENVFVHAFDKTISIPHIIIDFKVIKGNLICTIQDNGKGFDFEHISKTNSKGIILTNERLQLITTTYNEVQITRNKTGGTDVILTIPIR